jgi:hypothetical protein
VEDCRLVGERPTDVTQRRGVRTSVGEQRLVNGTRNARYGEVLLGFPDDGIRVEVYNSYLLNECPQPLWDQLDATTLAAHHGAAFALLNGPRYWMMDGIGKVDIAPPTVKEFGGISMRLAATIRLEADWSPAPYRELTVNRGAAWYFDAGSPIYELVSPDARRFVLQAYCTAADPTLDIDGLGALAGRLELPAGWTFSSRLLDAELVVDTTGSPATVLQDELQNTYTLTG